MRRSRYLGPQLKEDLTARMVFLGGPRQVGKTTVALSLLGKTATEAHRAYLNWDHLPDRKAILRAELPSRSKLIVFDELHKYARWRSLIKGLYDKRHSTTSFLVTGSARLDYYRKGGDSLVGRYHYHRLHPFSVCELNKKPNLDDARSLLRFGGFPEPLFRGTDRFRRRWGKERLERVIYQDLRDLERIREVSLIELMLEHLPACVGSPLSIQSHRELLQVAHESVKRWIEILERVYIVFRIPPYGAARIRAVKKEQKLYFWDWSDVEEDGSRFENMVASHLLKFCHLREDTEGHKMELRYLRDTDKREVDFVCLEDKVPLFAVECKLKRTEISPATRYFRARTKIPKFYQVHLGDKDFGDEETDTRVLPFHVFCQELGLP